MPRPRAAILLLLIILTYPCLAQEQPYKVQGAINLPSRFLDRLQNDPILYSDPLGDTARGVNLQSAQREQQIIKGSFTGKGTDAVKKLFQLKGNTFKSIDQKALNKATANLSADQKALAKGYAEVINSTDVHNIEVVKRDENLSDMSKDAFGVSTGQQVNDQNGGGVSTYLADKGQYVEAIVMDATTNVPVKDAAGNVTQLAGSPGEISAHEILGHQLGHAHNTVDFSGLNSVQASNVYLRAQGITNYRFNHAGLPFSESKVNDIPSYLKQNP